MARLYLSHLSLPQRCSSKAFMSVCNSQLFELNSVYPGRFKLGRASVLNIGLGDRYASLLNDITGNSKLRAGLSSKNLDSVSYTHLTLPTN